MTPGLGSHSLPLLTTTATMLTNEEPEAWGRLLVPAACQILQIWSHRPYCMETSLLRGCPALSPAAQAQPGRMVQDRGHR